MCRSKIGAFLILTFLTFGLVIFEEVKGKVPTKSLVVMTYNIGTLNGERIESDKIGEVIRSQRTEVGDRPRLNPFVVLRGEQFNWARRTEIRRIEEEKGRRLEEKLN